MLITKCERADTPDYDQHGPFLHVGCSRGLTHFTKHPVEHFLKGYKTMLNVKQVFSRLSGGLHEECEEYFLLQHDETQNQQRPWFNRTDHIPELTRVATRHVWPWARL